MNDCIQCQLVMLCCALLCCCKKTTWQLVLVAANQDYFIYVITLDDCSQLTKMSSQSVLSHLLDT
jgi:hypothetical protein